MAWIENGPVSVPTTPVVVTVGVVLAFAAALSVGFGVKASWREANRPARGDLDSQAAGQAIIAQPIVELPQPQAAPAANTLAAATNSAKEADDSDDIAAKTAAAQAVQSKPAQNQADIDDILTSASERPQAPAKPSTDEAPPSGPVKSDVPF